MDNDELYFDNQDDDLSVEDQLLGPDDSDDESDRGRGDLNIALKKEREEKRQLKDENARVKKDLERTHALLEQIGQRREEPKVDREALRQTLSDRLLDRPDEVFLQRDQHLLTQVQRMNAPIYVKAAKSDVSEHPEYGDLYKSRPSFKKTVDAYIQNQVDTYGMVDHDALNETLSFLSEIANEGGGGKPSNDAAKAKLSSIVDKGANAGRKSYEQVLDEKLALAERGMKGDRKALQEYSKWEASPEGRAVLNKALKEGKL